MKFCVSYGLVRNNNLVSGCSNSLQVNSESNEHCNKSNNFHNCACNSLLPVDNLGNSLEIK